MPATRRRPVQSARLLGLQPAMGSLQHACASSSLPLCTMRDSRQHTLPLLDLSSRVLSRLSPLGQGFVLEHWLGMCCLLHRISTSIHLRRPSSYRTTRLVFSR
eukprot:2611916-Rhodomonas_salina.2